MTATLPQPTDSAELAAWVRTQLAEVWPDVEWSRWDGAGPSTGFLWRGTEARGGLTVKWVVVAHHLEPGVLVTAELRGGPHVDVEVDGDGETVAQARDVVIARVRDIVAELTRWCAAVETPPAVVRGHTGTAHLVSARHNATLMAAGVPAARLGFLCGVLAGGAMEGPPYDPAQHPDVCRRCLRSLRGMQR